MFLRRVPSTSEAGLLQAVDVEIRREFLLKDKALLAATIGRYSLDNGPVRCDDTDKVRFRFLSWDWQRKVRDLLAAGNIPFEVIGQCFIDPLDQPVKKKIYAHGDDPAMIDLLTKALTSAGFHVTASSDVLRLLGGNFTPIDLFLIDVKNTHDGFAICRHLRGQPATRQTDIILISPAPLRSRDALLVGATDFLTKPFLPHYLLNVVAKYTR